MSSQQGPNSGGDLFDMAKDGTKVPESAAQPNLIPSKPRPDQIASASDPNQIGGANLAEAADNQGDIPRSTRDVDHQEILTGTGDALPAQTMGKRLHNVPGGVTQDPQAKGSTRFEAHKAGDSDITRGATEGSLVDQDAVGLENLTPEQAADKVGHKE
ncbi:uncharacterized protein HMPREF1541_04724 [Cyphellophora europaea CBS 101466]|uniref:Uncharacterized protein n=1 Tax=Cyphellophora europaea (strain CBS 101466) TaxID=1220924 RepID=W2RVJ0_CYPE1|nr:uncharacterized protein HMPREF1541_04724 [Cyphellophora europaea CBS 101466]ETN40447.1 hypothetical protein HMPREF1541_04724 [Cyphellophora europaea CBS 101466]